ncbi:pfs domain-containing protein [Diplodia corticola]|uniref:Pfs domain-containing protein n=1 Tax=Diplodia corticola TaxID=236234 RepID=A0A1J9RPI9_9PEZI|nr:pfs domain-containing protein [Diplodia corticola]OJD29485.1 pfs domain-containing protein [Diplodia corticola]
MSGFEVAGIVLGTIPLALKSYSELGAFFTDFRQYRTQGVKLRLKCSNEADLFHASIRTLFSYSIDENVVKTMLDDLEHPSWADEDIQNRLGMILDGDLNLCEAVRRNVKIIQETLDAVLTTLRSVGLEEPATPSVTSSPAPSISSHYHRFSETCTLQLSKTKWAFSKKSKVELLLEDSAEANRYLTQFVYQARRQRKQMRPVRIISGKTIGDTKAVRDGYTKIYQALSVAWADCACPAHDVELALQCTLNEGSAGSLRQTPRDCGVIFHGGPLSGCWYAYPGGLKRQQVNAGNGSANLSNAKSIITQDGSTKPISNGKACTTHFKESQCIGQVCQSLQSLGWSVHEVYECHRHPSSNPSHGSNCFGVHVSGCTSHFEDISCSLSQLLSQRRTGNHLTELITYPYERVRIAYILALSLLRLYDSPWLKEKERWTSDQIRFVATQSSDAEQTVIPHVTASHEQDHSSPASPPAAKQIFKCVKNYQIYALGILMLELALGSPLVLSPPMGNSNDPEITEFLEAHKLNSNAVAGRMLGLRYGKVVSRCLMCDFSVNDFDLNSVCLQAAFYNLVVCELEGLLNDMSRVSSIA